MSLNENEELIFLRGEVIRLKKDLEVSNKNWKFQNERLQLSLNGALESLKAIARELAILKGA